MWKVGGGGEFKSVKLNTRECEWSKIFQKYDFEVNKRKAIEWCIIEIKQIIWRKKETLILKKEEANNVKL